MTNIMKGVNNIEIIYCQYTGGYSASRIMSTKTKFVDSDLYRCQRLTQWLRYKDVMFRWPEVLFFLDIPQKKCRKKHFVDLKLFSKHVEKHILRFGNFYTLLKNVEKYFNQENQTEWRERREQFSNWRQSE